MDSTRMVFGGMIALLGVIGISQCLRDKSHSTNSYLDFISASIWFIGGLIIFFS